MKKRNSFQKIIVEDKIFQYTWSWVKANECGNYIPLFIFYDDQDNRKEIRDPFNYLSALSSDSTWFGKHGHQRKGRGIHYLGMRQANEIITKYLKGGME